MSRNTYMHPELWYPERVVGMGINISIETIDRVASDRWDDLRYAGDDALVEAVRRVGCEVLPVSGFLDQEFIRPVSVAAFREAGAKALNADRWALAADILEDPSFWIRVSY